MTASLRGRRALKIVAVLLAVPLLGLAAVFVWIQRVADQRWAAAQSRIAELRAAHPVELPPRAQGPGKEIQIHFVAAIREAGQRISLAQDVRYHLTFGKPANSIETILGETADFFDRVHQGARLCAASPSDFPPGWRGEWDEEILSFMKDCAILRSRRQRQAKKPLEAALTILDSLQLGRFWAASGTGPSRSAAMSRLRDTTEELRDLLSTETLSRDELGQIARELEPLEAAVRSPLLDLDSELARWSEDLLVLDLKGSGLLGLAPYRWRWFLPERLMKAEAFEFCDRAIQGFKGCDGKPFSELWLRWGDLGVESGRSLNPIIDLANVATSGRRWDACIRMTELRLLRIAAHYRAGGGILPLKDPFGGEILHSKTETRMKFWSVFEDGKDDGGDAGSPPRWVPHVVLGGPIPRVGNDLVIEVDHPRPD